MPTRVLLLCLLLASASVTLLAADPKPSPPVNVARWKNVPCVKGRLATDEDTRAGRAVFVLRDGRALDLTLPHCAVWHDPDRHEDVPVVIIQAEEKGGKKIAGFRLLKGGMGAGLLSELTLLDAPDARFKP